MLPKIRARMLKKKKRQLEKAYPDILKSMPGYRDQKSEGLQPVCVSITKTRTAQDSFLGPK